MSVNTTIGEKLEVKEKSFPKIMRSKRNYTLVLFNANEVGTVLDIGDSSYSVGYSSGGWDMDAFEDFNEPVTLQNGDE